MASPSPAKSPHATDRTACGDGATFFLFLVAWMSLIMMTAPTSSMFVVGWRYRNWAYSSA
jgi:hypothetical protein